MERTTGVNVKAASTIVALLLSTLTGCSKGDAKAAATSGEVGPGPTPTTGEEEASAKPEAEDEPELALALPESAELRRRSAIAPRDEPILGPHLVEIREHFGDAAKVDLETIRLSETRTAVLLSAGAKHLLFAIDQGSHGEASTIAWTKNVPLAGTFVGATDLALTSGPHGEVNLAWFDPTTKSVAFRRWRFDGLVEADWMLGKLDACDAVTAAYWPKQGWLVAASNLGTARLYLLEKGGTVRWKGGIEVDFERAERAPLTLLPDGESSVIVVGVGTARHDGRRAEEHVLATRLDADGEVLWDAKLDLGPAPAKASWITGHTLGAGRVAIETGPHHGIEIGSSGAFKTR